LIGTRNLGTGPQVRENIHGCYERLLYIFCKVVLLGLNFRKILRRTYEKLMKKPDLRKT